jgi:hypothetical protein
MPARCNGAHLRDEGVARASKEIGSRAIPCYSSQSSRTTSRAPWIRAFNSPSGVFAPSSASRSAWTSPLAQDADVVVLNTNSRPDSPAEAARKVFACGQYVSQLGVSRVYKKIDSTMRGNVGAELDALMESLGVRSVVITPAFPAVGRTVVEGILLIEGVPWETDSVRRRERPLASSYLPHLIASRRAMVAVSAGSAEVVAGALRGKAAAGAGSNRSRRKKQAGPGDPGAGDRGGRAGPADLRFRWPGGGTTRGSRPGGTHA